MDVINHAAAGPFAAACLVLGIAGVAKVRRPATTRAAATALGLPGTSRFVRGFGVVEIVTAGAGLCFGHAGAAAVAALYVALAIAAARLATRAPTTPCGCIGATNTPASVVHVAVNASAVVVAAVATGAGPPLGAVGPGIWNATAFVALVGCGAAMIDVLIELLPGVRAAVQEGAPG